MPYPLRLGQFVRLPLILVTVVALAGVGQAKPQPSTYRIDHVTDGDTVVLRNGQRVRLVQIDTPEKFFGLECYAQEASDATEGLLPEDVRVRLLVEPSTDRVDEFGRLLRYVVRASDGLNVNVRLVAIGAAAPYFYRGRGACTRTSWKRSQSTRERDTWGSGVRAREPSTTPIRESKRTASSPGRDSVAEARQIDDGAVTSRLQSRSAPRRTRPRAGAPRGRGLLRRVPRLPGASLPRSRTT